MLHRLSGLGADRVLLIGLGDQKEFSETAFRDAIRSASNALKNLGAKDATLAFAARNPIVIY